MNNREALKLLQFLESSGKIDLSDAKEKMEKQNIENFIKENHPYDIWFGSGRWKTWIFDESRPEKRRLIAKVSKDKLLEYLYRHYAGEENTLRTLYPKWLSYKRLQSASDLYPDRINVDWNRFYAPSKLVDVALVDLTPLMLEEWVLRIIKQYSLTKTAYNNMAIILRQALDYAVRLHLIETNPFREVRIDTKRLLVRPQKKEDKDQVFTDEEVHHFESIAWNDSQNPGKRVYTLAPLAALFLFYTGLRVGELTGLKISDIHADQIYIRRFVRREDHKVIEHPKTESGYRSVQLTENSLKVLEAVLEHPRSGDWVFSEYNTPLPSRIVEEYFAKTCSIIGTTHKSTHCARKTFTSCLIDSGININTVRKTVGHSDERTTLKNYVYDRATPAKKKLQFEAALSYHS